jgi:large subunit ribosomal protein L35
MGIAPAQCARRQLENFTFPATGIIFRKNSFTKFVNIYALRKIMLKTKKSISKRFKVTATGKVLRRTAGYGHLLRNKSTKSQRRSGWDKAVSPGFSPHVRRAMPFA